MRPIRYVEHAKPWEMKKDAGAADELRDVCTVALNLFRQLAIYLAPCLPELSAQCGELLGDEITSWEQSRTPLVGTPVAKFQTNDGSNSNRGFKEDD